MGPVEIHSLPYNERWLTLRNTSSNPNDGIRGQLSLPYWVTPRFDCTLFRILQLAILVPSKPSSSL